MQAAEASEKKPVGLPQKDRTSALLVEIYQLLDSCTEQVVQQTEVMELARYGRRACSTLFASRHDGSTVVYVVNKLDRR